MIAYLTVCGTGERPGDPDNTLGQVAGLLGSKVTHIDVEYPASIACFNPQGNISGPSEAESRKQGVAALVAAIRATPYRAVISGYSLGALVVSDLLELLELGFYQDCEISAVVNLANPARAAGHSYGLPSVGWGIDGQHAAWPASIPAYEIANMADPIASSPADSPWRQLADDIRRFNVSIEGLEAFFSDMLTRLAGQRAAQAPGNWMSVEFWQAYAAAPAALWGYLFGGEHTTKYGEPLWFTEAGQPATGLQLAAEAVGKYA